MAYVSPEMKAKIAPVIKALCAKYGVKGTLAVRHNSTLVLNIRQGEIDFISNINEVAKSRFGADAKYVAKDYVSVNVYHVENNYTGRAKEFLLQAVAALKGEDYFDKSDMMTDYFHCSHYVDINVGKFDKPYALVK